MNSIFKASLTDTTENKIESNLLIQSYLLFLKIESRFTGNSFFKQQQIFIFKNIATVFNIMAGENLSEPRRNPLTFAVCCIPFSLKRKLA